MSLIQLFRILSKNLGLLILCSLLLAGAVYFFTRSQPETYTSTTEIYTGIASGMDIESIGGVRTDYFAANNEYSNLFNVITSKQTAVEVGENLLLKHLTDVEQTRENLTGQGWEQFSELVPKSLRDSLRVPGSREETRENIHEFRSLALTNSRAQRIFENDKSPYSYKAIRTVNVERIGNSDLIEITYTWIDPSICTSTLEILNEVFSQRLLDMKVQRSDDVVDYFRTKVEEAGEELEAAEEALMNFRVDNRILDYTVQTKSLTSTQTGLEEQYQKELQAQAAARAKVAKLDQQLAFLKERLKHSDELLRKRNELAELNSRILELEVYYNDPERVNKLKRQAEELKAEVSLLLDKVYEQSRSKEGISSDNLVHEWMEATLALDESEARLEILAANMNRFDDEYSQMSPLGSRLTKLERVVEIAEKKYLELNHSLNWAVMRQQSETIATSGITVTTPPTYPLEPVESRQLLLVVLAAVVGFLVPLAFVLLVEFLDHSVKTPQRGEELTGLKLVGAYPDVRKSQRAVNLSWLKNKSAGLISQNLRLEMHRMHKGGRDPRYLLVCSTRDNDGKSFIASLLADELSGHGKRVLLLTPDDLSASGDVDVHNYNREGDFIEVQTLNSLVPAHLRHNDYDYVIVELQAILSNQYPIELVEKFDLALCVVSAKRSWNKADKYALSEFSETMGSAPRLVVNGVSPDYMDQVLGDIQKKRSWLRRVVKGMVTLQFRSKAFKNKKARA